MSRPQIIVLEGPDGAGKSTLLSQLADGYGAYGEGKVRTMHFGMPDPNVSTIDTYTKPLFEWEAQAEPDDLLVIDRLHLGEVVYGPLMRGESRLTKEDRETIDDLLLRLGAACFLVQPNLPELMRRFAARGDDLVVSESLPYIWHAYAMAIEMNPALTWTVLDEEHQRLFSILKGGILS